MLHIRRRYDPVHRQLTPSKITSLLNAPAHLATEDKWDTIGDFDSFLENLTTYTLDLQAHALTMPDPFFIGILFSWLNAFAPTHAPLQYALTTIHETITRSSTSLTPSATTSADAYNKLDTLLRAMYVLHTWDNIQTGRTTATTDET
jgi:hypothetical protein